MSGIAGLWNLDGKPVDQSVLARMSARLHHRGPDGEGRHLNGAVGFAHQRLWVTQEEGGEIQPLLGAQGIMMVFDGRIDNRDELRRSLDVAGAASDAAYVLAAYHTWGDTFVERLNGDFALAVFDPRRQRLLLARDAIGIRPVYYFQSERLFAFASEIKPLLAHPDIPTRPDDEGLADFVLLGSRPVDRQEVTCFAGISALVPAHLLVATPEGVTSRRYWDFDRGRSLHLGSFAEYAEAFHERFSEAVRRRMRSAAPVAISVSGGLDSSSIFCQAETLRREGRISAPSLFGISYFGPAGGPADERRYVQEIERRYGVDIALIPVEPFLGVTHDAEGQVRAVETPLLDDVWGVTRQVQLKARNAGARVLVTGHWGDQVLFSTAYLVDLFWRPAWRQLRLHTRGYRRWCGELEARELTRRFVLDLLRGAVPGWLVQPLKWIRRRLFARERREDWLAAGFRQRGLKNAVRPATVGKGFHSAQARSLYLEARSKYHVQCLSWNSNSGALDGLVPAFPFLDRDLLSFLMMVPGDIQNHAGVPRALLREAMRGVLPEAIRERDWKADFTKLSNASVARDLDSIARILTPSSAGARRGYFRADNIAAEVARLGRALPTAANSVAGWELGDLLGLELWLRVFLEGHLQESNA